MTVGKYNLKCILCKQEAENGTTTGIVSLGNHSAGQTTLYTNFQQTPLWFFETCWRVDPLKKKELQYELVH